MGKSTKFKESEISGTGEKHQSKVFALLEANLGQIRVQFKASHIVS